MTTNQAETYAKVTGSVGATVVCEHRAEDGTLVIDSIAAFGKVAIKCPKCEGLMVSVRAMWRCTGCGTTVKDAS